MNPEQFTGWVVGASPGDSTVYHRGVTLMSGLSPGEGKPPVAAAALEACERGEVLLTQRRVSRLGSGLVPFEYVATRSSA